MTDRAQRHIAAFVASAQWRGDDICGQIMDGCGIGRNPENYVLIIKLLHTYRKRILRGKKK